MVIPTLERCTYFCRCICKKETCHWSVYHRNKSPRYLLTDENDPKPIVHEINVAKRSKSTHVMTSSVKYLSCDRLK